MEKWKIVVITYLLVGVAIILATRARKEVFQALTPAQIERVPTWKAVAFYAISTPIALFFWPIFLPGWLRKKETAWDAFQDSFDGGLLKEVFNAMGELAADGCDSDEIPGAQGEFGFHLSNPVPTNTTMGSRSYLGKLRTGAGGQVMYERIGSFSSPISDMPVDGYELRDSEGMELGVIYISPYHRRNSNKAPSGFELDQ